MHSVQENMAPTIAKFLAYDMPLWPMSLRTSLAVGVLRGSLGSKPTLVSMPAVKTPKAPPRTNPGQKKGSNLSKRRLKEGSGKRIMLTTLYTMWKQSYGSGLKRLRGPSEAGRTLTADAGKRSLEAAALHDALHPLLLGALGRHRQAPHNGGVHFLNGPLLPDEMLQQQTVLERRAGLGRSRWVGDSSASSRHVRHRQSFR